MDDSPLNNLFDGLDSPANADSSSSTESPPSSTSSQSPPPASPPPSTQSAPPTNSSGFPSSPPSPSLGSPPAPKAVPSPPAPKRSGDGGSSSDSGNSKGGSSPSGRDKSNDGSPPVAAIVAGAVIGVLAFSLLLAIAACVCCTKKKKKKPPHMNMPYYTDANGNVYYANSMPKWQNNVDHGGGWHPQYSPGQVPMSGEMSVSHGTVPPPQPPGLSLGFSKSSFSYEELASATGGFSSANLLGQGGFGYVFKGVLPGSGKEVAVKQLKAGSGQGEREFQAEVEIISRVHHRHLVSLVGYCIAGSSQRLLVYEFVANNTLEHHLHGKGVPVMDWPTRLAIALGSAKGLAYLHEDCHPRIIHRDIKAANILLDENFEAKVADFGLAKLTTDNNTHVSTRVMGTFGYLAPEYASSGKLTDKSDVFSFGVMLLELITGRRPVDPTNYMEDSLVDWARPLLARALSEDGSRSFDELIDQRLDSKLDRMELERMAACAAAAVRHSAKRRPKMKQARGFTNCDTSEKKTDQFSKCAKRDSARLIWARRSCVRWRATRRWTT
ncbi:hypothetical protein GUJ93_ZPchr0006g45241 [Zizania palustris]|uniref:non-specific serine/threonine protein kinase n=1 Tax=Zizania palustris TaxID=103762 RepID=A0A8J5TAB2_ZIZPA|nr:hypothetical protein GUJ93_ZPchr0006g45241 [Zizania palustris]